MSWFYAEDVQEMDQWRPSISPWHIVQILVQGPANVAMQQTIEPSHLRIFEATLYWDGLIDSSRDDQILRFPAWNSPKHLQDLEIKINAVQLPPLMAARF